MSISAAPQVDFKEIGTLGNDVLPRLDEVREREPISWNDSMNGWLITRHEDVLAALQDKYPLSCVRMSAERMGVKEAAAFASRYPIMTETLPTWITNLDPPDHRRLRMLMMQAFKPKLIEALRPFVRETIARVLDSIAGRDEVDFVSDVARQITGRVILHKFGLGEAMFGKLEQWAYVFNNGLGVAKPPENVLDMAENVFTEMRDVFSAELEKRRKVPQDDFLSHLVKAQDGDSVLTDEEILGICYLTIVAGHDSTLNSMTLGVAALSRDRAGRDDILSHPEAMQTSVMEIMRLIGMSMAFDRVATADFEWHGKQVRKGDRIWMLLAIANRDPRVFPDPAKLDPRRAALDQVVVFGSGIHHCIGHQLAKMQLTEFFPAFFARFPEAHAVSPQLDFQPAMTFRGVDQLAVKLF